MGILPKQVATVIPDNTRQSIKRFLQQFFQFGLTKISGGKSNALLWSYGHFELTPFIIFQGFSQGSNLLPNLNGGTHHVWEDPELRGIIPIADFKLRNDLLRCLKKEKTLDPTQQLEIRINSNFNDTIVACARTDGKKNRVWLTSDFIKSALHLHEMGIAHSIEAYQNGILVGGVIGFAINGYFITLSLFHTVDNASKIAFYYLLVKLKDDGFILHLSGAANSWFTQYGMINVQKDEFRISLMQAIATPTKFSTTVPQLTF
nr:leucyl/phenylalanyl-tRNA--protein transferase [Pedobacter panaciterrae]